MTNSTEQLNNRDPITLKPCKNPVEITLADGTTRHVEARTLHLTCKQQRINPSSLLYLIQKVNAEEVRLFTPYGCFDIAGGMRIMNIKILTTETSEAERTTCYYHSTRNDPRFTFRDF